MTYKWSKSIHMCVRMINTKVRRVVTFTEERHNFIRDFNYICNHLVFRLRYTDICTLISILFWLSGIFMLIITLKTILFEGSCHNMYLNNNNSNSQTYSDPWQQTSEILNYSYDIISSRIRIYLETWPWFLYSSQFFSMLLILPDKSNRI